MATIKLTSGIIEILRGGAFELRYPDRASYRAQDESEIGRALGALRTSETTWAEEPEIRADGSVVVEGRGLQSDDGEEVTTAAETIVAELEQMAPEAQLAEAGTERNGLAQHIPLISIRTGLSEAKVRASWDEAMELLAERHGTDEE